MNKGTFDDSFECVTYQERIALPAQDRFRFTAKDFWMLADAGAFEDYARSELIEGEIWVVNSVHSWHARTMARFTLELGKAIENAAVDLELYLPVSVSMSKDSVPEPDISLAEDNRDGPLPLAKLRLAIEITDTSEDMDLVRKPRLYARHGVPEYWVVHRNGGCVVRHSTPTAGGYADVARVPFGEPVVSATLAGVSVDTSRIDR